MRENMAASLNAQLDFIFFFYGLAFILFGAVCFAISRGRQESTAWATLGLFGFVHGAAEWLDLIGLIVADGPGFAAFRTTVMTGSYVFLVEFARQESIRLGWKMPGRWIYVPLLALVAFGGLMQGLTTANVVARYALGFVGAVATSHVFVRHAQALSGNQRRLAISAAVGFGLYAVAAGVIAPAAPLWPASAFNQQWFVLSTGIPIQLIRGLLGCWIAFSVWAIWGQKLLLELSSARYARIARQQFIWTLAAMGTIVIAGWLLTNYLGEIYNENVQADAGADLNLLASRLASETAIAEGMVKLLAAAPSVQSLLTDRSSSGQRMLDSTVEASGAKRGFILDRSGTVVAMAGNHGGTLNVRPTYASAPFFRKSIAGEGGHAFTFDADNRSRDYNTYYPVRADTGEVVGVAVLAKSLHVFEEDLRYYEGAYFLLDPSGVVVLTNHPEFMLRTFWPVPVEAQSELSRQFGRLDYRPILKQEITSPAWMLVDGARAYVARRLVDRGQWSLAVLKAPERIYASRVMGIAITLLTTIIALVFLLGRERAFHDRVQMDKRLELQQMASDLRFRASTDPLTSLNNRLKFNEAMSTEISRAERYNTPLCLVLYDIDHFKLINDTHGHTAGDDVLIDLSRFVASQIRNVDVLARWGGEEFAILLPEANAKMAFQLAEKLRESISINSFSEAVTVTCSFGIAQFESGDTPRALVARADKALYQAKIRGRNRVETAPLRVSAQRAAGEESAA